MAAPTAPTEAARGRGPRSPTGRVATRSRRRPARPIRTSRRPPPPTRSPRRSPSVSGRTGSPRPGRTSPPARGAYQPPVGTAAAEARRGRRRPARLARPAGRARGRRRATTSIDLWRACGRARGRRRGARRARRRPRAYERTLAIAGDWQLPSAVRDALRAWQFDTADAPDGRRADGARPAQRRSPTSPSATASRCPATCSGCSRTGDLVAEASARAEAERAAILAIADARPSRSSDDDLLSRIGSLGENPDADLAAARSVLLAAGDLPARSRRPTGRSAPGAARGRRAAGARCSPSPCWPPLLVLGSARHRPAPAIAPRRPGRPGAHRWRHPSQLPAVRSDRRPTRVALA